MRPVAVRAGATLLALTLLLCTVSSALAEDSDFQGRAFSGPDGAIYLVKDGRSYPVQLVAPGELHTDTLPVDSLPVVRLDSDPRVTGAISWWWGAGDRLHADPVLQGRFGRLPDGTLCVYRDAVLYRVQLANMSADLASQQPVVHQMVGTLAELFPPST